MLGYEGTLCCNCKLRFDNYSAIKLKDWVLKRFVDKASVAVPLDEGFIHKNALRVVSNKNTVSVSVIIFFFLCGIGGINSAVHDTCQILTSLYHNTLTRRERNKCIKPEKLKVSDMI